MEPSVFIEAAKIGLTTSILYNCVGIDADSGRRFHCWITDRTIPLDDFCRDDDAIKDRCSLAAFCCILRAALHGLYLSDCHFFNFGVQLNENATELLVVIIDAAAASICMSCPVKLSAFLIHMCAHMLFHFHLHPKDDSTCDHCDIEDS